MVWNGCHGLVRHAGYWSLTDDCSVFLAAASVSVTGQKQNEMILF